MKKSKKFIIGIVLAVVGVIGLMGLFNSDDRVPLLIGSLILIAVGAVMIFLDYNKKTEQKEEQKNDTNTISPSQTLIIPSDTIPEKPKVAFTDTKTTSSPTTNLPNSRNFVQNTNSDTQRIERSNVHSTKTTSSVKVSVSKSSYTKLSGVTKKNEDGDSIQKILSALDDGEELEFVREYDNPYDGNAIKVYCNEQHIGYIKADLAKKLAPKVDSGEELIGYISEITGGYDGKSYGCNICFEIQ